MRSASKAVATLGVSVNCLTTMRQRLGVWSQAELMKLLLTRRSPPLESYEKFIIKTRRELVDSMRAGGIRWRQVCEIRASQARGMADERQPS